MNCREWRVELHADQSTVLAFGPEQVSTGMWKQKEHAVGSVATLKTGNVSNAKNIVRGVFGRKSCAPVALAA